MCDFDFVSYSLGAIYFLLLLFVLRYFFQLTLHGDSNRSAQKVFLLLVSFQCVGRCLYFFMWPRMGDKCSPSASANSFLWINGLGNLPPALFIAAFSILIFTFARIYHRVLLIGIPRERFHFSLLIFLLISLNCLATGSEIGEWASENTGNHEYFSELTSYSIAGVSLALAGLFWIYGTLLYKQVERVLAMNLPGPPEDLQGENSRQQQEDWETENQQPSFQRSFGSPYNVSHEGEPNLGRSPPSAPIPLSRSGDPLPVSDARSIRAPMNSQPIQVKGVANMKHPLLGQRVLSDSPTNPHLLNPRTAQRSAKSSSLSPVYMPRPELMSPPVDRVEPLKFSPSESDTEVQRRIAAASRQPIASSRVPERDIQVYTPSSNLLRPPQDLPAFPTSSSDYHHSLNYMPPVNPMRKLAIIAGICTLCLFLRTVLLLVIVILGSVFDWSLTLLYFSLSEIIPLLLMLRVFDTPSPVVPQQNEGQGEGEDFERSPSFGILAGIKNGASVPNSAQSSASSVGVGGLLALPHSGSAANFGFSLALNAPDLTSVEYDNRAEALLPRGEGSNEQEFLSGLDDIDS